MSRMMDADKFLSWLSEVEGEIRKEKMKDCQPDRYDDGLMAATGTVREYVEKMCKIDEAEGKADQKWIPCSEKMPEDNTDVIVCFYSGTVTEMRYWGNGIFQGIYEHTAKTIVAWMPLPKPYKEEE